MVLGQEVMRVSRCDRRNDRSSNTEGAQCDTLKEGSRIPRGCGVDVPRERNMRSLGF